MSKQKEEIIFKAIDSGWGKELPITLITWENGNIDIHRQTGTDFDKHMEEAKKILKDRGLKVDESDGCFIGPTGCYQKVINI